MSYVAVRFFGDLPIECRDGPDIWPARVREIGAQSTFSEGGHTWSIMTTDDYRTYVEDHHGDYVSWIASQPVNPQQAVAKAIRNARRFGARLRDEYAAENVLGGITTAQVSSLLELLAPLNNLLDTGSLQTAYEQALSIPTDQHPFWTDTIRDHLREHIYNYLHGVFDAEMEEWQ